MAYIDCIDSSYPSICCMPLVPWQGKKIMWYFPNIWYIITHVSLFWRQPNLLRNPYLFSQTTYFNMPPKPKPKQQQAGVWIQDHLGMDSFFGKAFVSSYTKVEPGGGSKGHQCRSEYGSTPGKFRLPTFPPILWQLTCCTINNKYNNGECISGVSIIRFHAMIWCTLSSFANGNNTHSRGSGGMAEAQSNSIGYGTIYM